MTPNEEPTTDLAEKVRALPGLLVYPGKIDGDHISRSAVLALIEARATATPRLPSVTALANALHDVDDDVQFIRRDARNFPVLAGRLRAALSASGETEARATATPGLDVALDDVMEGFRARHPNVSVFATATPGLREALRATARALADLPIWTGHPAAGIERIAAQDVVRDALLAALSASGETEPS